MGSTIYYNLQRSRPLDEAERKVLGKHARKWQKKTWECEGYGLGVAQKERPDGLVATGSIKIDHDEASLDLAQLLAALTELRGLIGDATLHVTDDLRLVGWDGTTYVLDGSRQEPAPAFDDLGDGWEAASSFEARTRKPAAGKPLGLGALLEQSNSYDQRDPACVALDEEILAHPNAAIIEVGLPRYAKLRNQHGWYLVRQAMQREGDCARFANWFLGRWRQARGRYWYLDLARDADPYLTRVPAVEAELARDVAAEIDSDAPSDKAEIAAEHLKSGSTMESLAILVACLRRRRGPGPSFRFDALYHSALEGFGHRVLAENLPTATIEIARITPNGSYAAHRTLIERLGALQGALPLIAWAAARAPGLRLSAADCAAGLDGVEPLLERLLGSSAARRWALRSCARRDPDYGRRALAGLVEADALGDTLDWNVPVETLREVFDVPPPTPLTDAVLADVSARGLVPLPIVAQSDRPEELATFAPGIAPPALDAEALARTRPRRRGCVARESSAHGGLKPSALHSSRQFAWQYGSAHSCKTTHGESLGATQSSEQLIATLQALQAFHCVVQPACSEMNAPAMHASTQSAALEQLFESVQYVLHAGRYGSKWFRLSAVAASRIALVSLELHAVRVITSAQAVICIRARVSRDAIYVERRSPATCGCSPTVIATRLRVQYVAACAS